MNARCKGERDATGASVCAICCRWQASAILRSVYRVEVQPCDTGGDVRETTGYKRHRRFSLDPYLALFESAAPPAPPVPDAAQDRPA